MTQPPVIDALFHAIVSGDQESWTQIDNYRAAELVDVRALVSTTNPGGVDLDLGLGIAANEYVTPIFEGPRANFISRHTSIQAGLDAGRSAVLLDYSLSFDSNFAEKLRATLNGENIQEVERARVIDVLRLKASNSRVQFDVIPFLFENVRLAREDEDNKRPLNTLIAFRMLDHLNWEAFREDSRNLVFDVDAESLKDSLLPAADEFLSELYSSADVVKHEAKSLGIQALLLRFAALWHAPQRDSKHIFRELLDYCIYELGYLPSTELSLIWCGISTKQSAPFLGPITGKAKNMLTQIRGMAWDMTHLRLMEQVASKSVLGSFFIPYFVSLDARWRHLLRLNPIRFMLIDDSGPSLLSGRTNEASFQMMYQECMSEKMQHELSSEKVAARRAAATTIDIETMRRLVAEEEQFWL